MINKGGGFPCQGKPPPFPLSYSLFQLLQVIRIRVRKSLVKILDHGIQIGQMKRQLHVSGKDADVGTPAI